MEKEIEKEKQHKEGEEKVKEKYKKFEKVVEIKHTKRTSNKMNNRVKSVEVIKTLPKRSLRLAMEKTEKSNEAMEQKIEQLTQRVLRSSRSWPRNKQIIKSTTSNHGNKSDINSNKSGESDFKTHKRKDADNGKDDSRYDTGTFIRPISKLTKNRPQKSISRKKSFNVDEIESDSNMNSYALTNGDSEYTHGSDETENSDNNNLYEVSMEKEDDDSIEVGFNNSRITRNDTEKSVKKSVENLPQIYENKGKEFIDENNEKIADSKSVKNNDSENSSGIEVDLENSTSDSIQIELNNNNSDKLVGCLAGIDLTSLNIEIENEGEFEQNETKSEQNNEVSEQIETDSIQNQQELNVVELVCNENAHDVLIEKDTDSTHNTIYNQSEALIEVNTETPPLNLTYYVYQIPYESTEMAIQIGIPCTNDIPPISTVETPFEIETDQTFELCEVEVSNENIELLENDSISEDVVSEDENIVTKPNENTAKNYVTRSSVKSPKNFDEPRRSRRGRPLGSKNIKVTDINLYSPDIFHCDLCPDKVFKSRLGLKNHISRHITDKLKQKCSVCDQRPRNLEHHMRMKHSNVKHKCDFCDASFKNKENQLIHMRMHTGERPYVCGTCSMSFRAQATCRKHENRVHRFLKKYRCEDCGRSFHSPYLLEDHTYAFHTGERPYACNLCGKNFSTRHYLRTHKITHGEKVHKCRHCDKMFALTDNRRKHERRFHKIK